jgi:cytochrome bd-type quinol oxidase subunit 2
MVAYVANALLWAGHAAAAGEISAGAQQAQPAGTSSNLQANIRNITNTLLLVVGVVAVIMLIIGGLRYILSGGDEAGTRSAKDTILYSVIGIIVALLAYAIVNFVIGRF